MRKIIWLVLLLSCSVLVKAQYSINGAYTFNGSSWIPAASTSVSNPASSTPPSIHMYCFNSGTGKWVPADSSCFGGGGGGSGTVTSFSAGNTTLFTTTVGTPTTTPALSFTLANRTANSVIGALTATTPSDLSLPSCSGATNALIWTSGTGFGCNTIAGTVSSVGFTGGLISVASQTTTPAFTVAGTSGGMPYFSSASTWASSGALTANVLVKGGGVGAAPSNSSVTDNGTTVTTTDTGGYVAPVFVANGTTAGFADFPQGTTSSAVAPCNTATSICEQAPTSVTSYLITKPGAAPTNNFSSKTTTTAGVESFNKMAQSAFVTGSAYTNATTGFTSITGLSFAVDASTNYRMSCHLYYQGSATTASPIFQLTGPASPTAVGGSLLLTTTSGASAVFYSLSTHGSTFALALGPTAIVTTATDMSADLEIGVVNGANAGTLQLQAKSNGTGTITVQIGSFCMLQ